MSTKGFVNSGLFVCLFFLSLSGVSSFCLFICPQNLAFMTSENIFSGLHYVEGALTGVHLVAS